MAAEQFALQIWFTSLGGCYKCGEAIVTTSNRARFLREQGGEFFCSNGHAQVYSEPENTKLKKQLEAAERRVQLEREAKDRERSMREHAERSAQAYRGKVTAIKNRVANGVCPCCNRTFQNLGRHMATKHPSYTKEEAK